MDVKMAGDKFRLTTNAGACDQIGALSGVLISKQAKGLMLNMLLKTKQNNADLHVAAAAVWLPTRKVPKQILWK
jgi:hypothetical protein